MKISGDLERFYNSPQNNSSFGKLIGVSDWGGMKWANMSRMFAYADHLNTIPIAPPHLSRVGDLSFMFSHAFMFNQPLESWDTSNVTSFYHTFWNAYVFNQPLASWNTSNVTNMAAMFAGTRAFNQPIGNWDTSKVTEMLSMFW